MWEDFWNLRVNERLTRWKLFRRKISELPINEAAELVNNKWDKAPYVVFYLEADDPTSWPDPWELLAENYYCDLAKALGMLYTLYFSAHKEVDMSLDIYYDFEGKERYYLVNVNNQYFLNCWPQRLVNTKQLKSKNYKLLHSYTKHDLQLEKY